jgi:hypothetical protein
MDRSDGKNDVRVYGDPALTKPSRRPSGNGATTELRTRTAPNYHRSFLQVAFLTRNVQPMQSKNIAILGTGNIETSIAQGI